MKVVYKLRIVKVNLVGGFGLIVVCLFEDVQIIVIYISLFTYTPYKKPEDQLISLGIIDRLSLNTILGF